MEIVGIICEYNPFHNGHIYHIQKAKEKFPNSIIILCLNGYFLERGEVSILNKEAKTRIALQHGVDIVIELPIFYGTQSADYFAEASITLLFSLGVTHLVFGAENTELQKLYNIAQKELSADFKPESSKSGWSYPARLNEALGETDIIEPNNLLAISYLKAIMKNNFPITPVAIQRTNSYHDIISSNSIVSASNIRRKIQNHTDITPFLPKEAKEQILKIDEQKMFELIKYRILTDSHLDQIMDVTEGLDYKLKKEILNVSNIYELLKALKSRRYTYTRLQRMLIHILLGIKKESEWIPIPYVHVLGFNLKGKDYLKKGRKSFSLPTKIDHDHLIYQYELSGALIYDMLTHTNSSNFDFQNKPIIYIEH